jgi:hypothetical protein
MAIIYQCVMVRILIHYMWLMLMSEAEIITDDLGEVSHFSAMAVFQALEITVFQNAGLDAS